MEFTNTADAEFNMDAELEVPTGSPAIPVPTPGGGAFNFAAAEDDLFEVETSDDPPPQDDDDGSVYSEMEDSDAGDEEADDRDVVDMAHTLLDRHTDSVYVSAVHPTKPNVIVSGGGDDRAFLWTYDISVSDVPTEARVLSCVELSGHTDTVTAVGFNFDGTAILTAAYDGTIRTWDSGTGTLRLVLDGPEDVEWAQWHSKGNAIVAGSKDGTIWMWLAHDGQCVQVFAGHEGGVSTGCFGSDGKLVCSGGDDGSVRVWAPKTGACKYVFDEKQGHDGLVTCMTSCQADADLLLTGSVDGTVKLFQLSGKRVLQTFVHCLPVANGATLTTVQEDDDMDQQEEEVETFSVECVGFAIHGPRWCASGGMDSTLKIWDLDVGSLRCTCTHTSTVTHLLWHQTLPVVVTSSISGNIAIWDARAGLQLAELTGHRAQVTHFSMRTVPTATGDMESIVTASDDRTSRVFLVDIKGLL